MARKMLILMAALQLRNGEAPVSLGGKEYDIPPAEIFTDNKQRITNVKRIWNVQD